jgi:aryl-alcohol dehydrogenase-like predicted oxidoreductase
MTTPAALPEYAVGRLGDRPVMRVGFGAMQLEHAAAAGGDDYAAGEAILRRAVELGVDHIDTAQFYGPGTVNELIRTALHPYAEGLQLISKVGAEPHPQARIVAAQRPEQLRAQVEANLATLGAEQLAAVNLRRADAAPGIIATGDQVVDLDSQLAELIALRDEGKIAGIGLSNVSLDQLRQAVPAGIVCVQNLYNMLERGDEDLLAECERNGIAWVPFFPLGSAFARQPHVTDHPVVAAHAGRLGATPAQAGLAWLLAHSPQTLLIPGTRSPGHLAENVAVAQVRLDAEAMAAFDALAG